MGETLALFGFCFTFVRPNLPALNPPSKLHQTKVVADLVLRTLTQFDANYFLNELKTLVNSELKVALTRSMERCRKLRKTLASATA